MADQSRKGVHYLQLPFACWGKENSDAWNIPDKKGSGRTSLYAMITWQMVQKCGDPTAHHFVVQTVEASNLTAVDPHKKASRGWHQ